MFAPCASDGTRTPTAGLVNLVTDAQIPLFPAPQTQATSDDYYTPAWIFERMGIEFDLDVAAPPGGIPWVPAKRYFTMEDDGLSQPWEGRVWMNPPFSKPSPWARKFIEHRHGVALVPHSKSAWHIALWEAADGCAMPGAGYFPFTGGWISIPVWFAAFGADCVEAISRLGRVR